MLVFEDPENQYESEYDTESLYSRVTKKLGGKRPMFSAKKRKEQDTMTRLSSILDDEISKIDDRTTNLTILEDDD